MMYKYFSILISGPLPQIDVHISLDQCLDMLSTHVTNAELENGNVI